MAILFIEIKNLSRWDDGKATMPQAVQAYDKVLATPPAT
jgi:hypothetical protein